jgi:Fur family transcriptional regulator, ferric uptake regulator
VGATEPLERVLEDLRRRGWRLTPQRRAIIAEILGSEGHITPTAMAARVQSRVPGVNASTVYRTLSLLDELGVLSHAHLEGGVEYHRAEEAGHVHLVCARCGAQQSLNAADVRPLTAHFRKRHGFVADLTHFAISGLCAECRRT